MSGIECVRDLVRSGVEDVDEVAEKCSLTRETARKYISRAKREMQSSGSVSPANNIEIVKKAIELVKSGRARSPADLVLELDISLEDAKKIFRDVSDAIATSIMPLDIGIRFIESYITCRESSGGCEFEDIAKSVLGRIAGIDDLKILRELYNHITKVEDIGFDSALDTFIDDPYEFYEMVIERAGDRGIKGFEPALFTAPCMKCGKPIIFTHRDNNWIKIRKILKEAFMDWSHVNCKK